METVWISKKDNRIYMVILCYCVHCTPYITLAHCMCSVYVCVHINAIRIKIINRSLCNPGRHLSCRTMYILRIHTPTYQQPFPFSLRFFLLRWSFGSDCNMAFSQFTMDMWRLPPMITVHFSLPSLILSLHLSLPNAHSLTHFIADICMRMVYFRLNREYICIYPEAGNDFFFDRIYY